MTFFYVMGSVILAGLGITWRFFRKGGIYNPIDPMASTDESITEIYLQTPRETPVKPPLSPITPPTPTLTTYDFSTAKNAFHSVRVICDEMGLTLAEKNLICSCIYQESNFHNWAKNQNKNKAGKVLSTDWGLCQINDFYHIGLHKDFPSVEYVVNNPDKVVRWMIHMYKNGLLKQWVSYSSGAYKKWLLPISPMWLLK